jgi:PAS domain S-box-containing protein
MHAAEVARRHGLFEDSMSTPSAAQIQEPYSPPEHMTAAVLANMRDGVMTIDRTGTITTINPQAQEILSLDERDCLGRKFGMSIFGRSELDRLGDVVIAAIADPNNVQTAEFELGAGRARRSLVLRTSAYRDPDSGVTNGIVAIVNDVTDQVRLLRDRIEFGYLTVFAVMVMSVSDVIGLASSILTVNFSRVMLVNWTLVLLMLIPVFYVMHRFQRPFGDIGITRRNLGRSLGEGALASIPLVLLCLAAAAVMRYRAGHEGYDILPTPSFATLSELPYLPHSFLQELLARGFLQGSFKRFLNDKSGTTAIFVASIVFGALHSHYGIFAMLVTFVSGLLFGWIYNRHDNLAGVTLCHFVGGAAIFAFGVLHR